jgi:hypothetical protein
MLSRENGSTHPKMDGNLREYAEKDDYGKKELSRESSWTALPDLILTLFPTVILLASGTNDGKDINTFKSVDRIRESLFDRSAGDDGGLHRI